MKISTILIPVLALSWQGQTLPAGQNTDGFVLYDVNVVNVENHTILPSKSLTVANGKIEAISDYDGQETYSGLTAIDGKSGYVTPGLIDMHVHLYEKAAYAIALSHGVTHVRIMNGIPAHLRWREQINKGQWIGSSSSVSNPILSAYKDAHLHHTVETPQHARMAVRQYHAQGYDLIKLYGNLPEDTLVAALEEAHKLDIPVAKHGPHASGNLPVTQLTGLQSLEHVEDIFQGPLNYQFTHEKLPAIINGLKSTQIPITPTLNIFLQLTKISREKEAYLNTVPQHYTSDIIRLQASQDQVKRWLEASDERADYNEKELIFLKTITKQLHEAGVPLLVGSDSGVLLSPHGLATHTEMRLMQESGLSNFDVLTSATYNAAQALGLNKQLGKIAQGYEADFLYTLDNPTENLAILTEPDAVIKSGSWYTKQALIQMRKQAIEERSLFDEMSVLLEAFYGFKRYLLCQITTLSRL